MAYGDSMTGRYQLHKRQINVLWLTVKVVDDESSLLHDPLSKRRGILQVTTWICVDFPGPEIQNIKRLQQRLREHCRIFR